MAGPSNYVRIDNAIYSNEKLLEVRDDLYGEVAALYIFIICKSDACNTDGVLSVRAVTGVRGLMPGRDDLLDEMIRVGLVVREGDHVRVPDYLEWQRTAEEKLSASERARIAVRARWDAATHAATHTEQDTGTHAEPHTECNTERNTTRNTEQASKEREKNTSPKRSKSERVLEGFDTFWNEQTRKEGKGAAKSAYSKALKKTTPDVILEGWRRSKRVYAAEGRDRRLYPLPATWLNQERWDDDYSAAREEW